MGQAPFSLTLLEYSNMNIPLGTTQKVPWWKLGTFLNLNATTDKLTSKIPSCTFYLLLLAKSTIWSYAYENRS